MTNAFTSKIAKAGLGLVVGAMSFSGALVASAQTAGCYQFTTLLKVGTTSEAVRQLQMVLNKNPQTALAVAAGANGSAGHETTYFGPATAAAVVKWQTANGIAPTAPQIGPMSRAKLNASCGVVTTTPTPTTPTQTGPVTAMLATDNPASGTVILGQATADLMHVALTGSGTVTGMTFQRTGLSLNTDLTNVYLYQGATRITDAASVNSTGVISFTGMNLMVNGSATISVRADIDGSASGSDVGVSLTGITTTSGTNTVTIAGNRMYIATGSGLLGTASVTMATASTVNVNAGTLNYTVWTAPMQINTHKMWLKGATFRYVGSAPMNSIANLGLYVDGVKVASSTGVNQYSYVVFDLTGAPYSLTTGSHTVDVRGDIVNGAARSFTLSVQSAGDLMITDSTVGVNVAPTVTGATSSFPASGNTIGITTGSLAIALDPAFVSMTNVTGGSTNAVIGRWKVNAYGEDEKITSITLTPSISGGSPSGSSLNNVQLYLNGSQVGSVCQFNGSTACTFNLGSSAIIAAGVTPSMFELRADIQTSTGTNYTAGTLTVSSSAINAQGMYSYNTVTSPVLPTTPGLTIQTGSLVVAKNAAYSNQTLSPNMAAQKIGEFALQNQSTSEAVRVTNLAVALTSDGSTALTSVSTPALTNFTNVKTSETSGSGAIPQNGAASMNFSVDFTIAPGSTKVISVYADLGSTSSGSVITTMLPTAYGVGSNVTLTPNSDTDGQTISLSTGSISAPTFVASSSTTPQYIATAVNGTDKSMETFQFTATNGSGTVNDLKFAVVTATAGTVSSIRVGSNVATVVTPAALTGASTNIYGAVYPTSATRFSVSDTSTISVGQIVKMDSEYVLVTSIPTATQFVVTRAVIGSSAATHATNVTMTLSGIAYLPGVNLTVPNGTSGIYVDAYSTYSPANGTTGAVSSGTTANTYLTYVKSTIGSTTSSAAVTPVPASTTSNLMTVVGSKPTLSVDTAQKTGLVVGAENKIGEVTVTADAAGTIGIKQIQFSVGNSGFSTGFLATSPRLADGSTTISTATCVATGTSLVTAPTTSETCTFSSDYLIPAGTSKTFSLFATVTGTTTSGTTVSASTALTSAGFLWTDVAGNGTSGAETGAKIYNFPTGSYSIRQ